MKRYYVDLTHFQNLEDRAAAYERVDGVDVVIEIAKAVAVETAKGFLLKGK